MSSHTTENSLEEIRKERERNMDILSQNHREEMQSSVSASSGRTTNVENKTPEWWDFRMNEEIPKSLEIPNSVVHKKEALLCVEKSKKELRQAVGEEKIVYEDSDSMFVSLPEGTHLRLAIENFLRMMEDKKEE
ncbi:hypothetical protein [Brazilian marseillevirus]|uniref:hypothetical protein n=1 Tax=Brazilian marseillevirus TaxID=1813599 RepID=UPI000782D0CD|nr:hypothetical protein A3303_gp402 [Brazilian marseillevirus]AMQ10910.1 hypothetical protein [Brazilian marseillevirus]